MEKYAHAKLNITLEIRGLRPDGYHELDMIFLELKEGDRIIGEKTKEGITLSCSDPSLPCDERNLAYRAAALMRERFGIKEGIRLHIEKRIPSQAGLGGGSSDAACVMNLMNELFCLDADPKELEEMAGALGSDVPFFIRGGCQRAKGRGEILTAIGAFPPCTVLVVKPDVSVSTPWAYRAYDQMEDPAEAGSGCTEAAEKAIRSGDFPALCAAMHNDLEAPVIKEYPEIGRMKEELFRLGADRAMMTGSGSAVFGLFSSAEKAASALAALESSCNAQIFLNEICSDHS